MYWQRSLFFLLLVRQAYFLNICRTTPPRGCYGHLLDHHSTRKPPNFLAPSARIWRLYVICLRFIHLQTLVLFVMFAVPSDSLRRLRLVESVYIFSKMRDDVLTNIIECTDRLTKNNWRELISKLLIITPQAENLPLDCRFGGMCLKLSIRTPSDLESTPKIPKGSFTKSCKLCFVSRSWLEPL